jgi:hypothetical protein
MSSGARSPLIYVWSTEVGENGRDDLLGFVESVGEHRWRAVGTRRARRVPRLWMYDLGFYSALAQARAAIRINALIPGKEIGDRPVPRAGRRMT